MKIIYFCSLFLIISCVQKEEKISNNRMKKEKTVSLEKLLDSLKNNKKQSETNKKMVKLYHTLSAEERSELVDIIIEKDGLADYDLSGYELEPPSEDQSRY